MSQDASGEQGERDAKLSRARPKRTRTSFFRATISSLIAVAIAAGIIAATVVRGDLDLADNVRVLVVAYVICWPVYVVLYVAWGSRVYGRLDAQQLERLARREHAEDSGSMQRFFGAGVTNTTVGAAVVAVAVTVLIAQRSEFRTEPFFIGMGVLTVASSWVLMVFSFAQSYLRIAAGSEPGTHIRLNVRDQPAFGDYVTLAVLLSTMAATVSAEFVSRPAWRLLRTNVLVAFVFNSVIIAMLVSLLFGGILS